MNSTSRFVLLTILLSMSLMATLHSASAYSPQQGDFFNYSESITVNNGQGVYSGYTDSTSVTGMEQVTSITGSTVSTHYGFNSQYTNSSGTYPSSKSGDYTWSSASFQYMSGTDNQVGYTPPILVWFAINPSTQVGNTFEALNTQMTVQSMNYSFALASSSTGYVQTIQAKGGGTYTRNDAYGVFTATFTWTEYFDPKTGYIVGYNYVETDSGQYQGQTGSFTYTDNLHVTTTSYPLATAAPPNNGFLFGIDPFLIIIVLMLILLLIVIILVIYFARRRRKTLPKHTIPPYTPQTPPPSQPRPSTVDLGSKPSEQVVIKEVAMVHCKSCGTLIPTTAERCPYCDAPNQ